MGIELGSSNMIAGWQAIDNALNLDNNDQVSRAEVDFLDRLGDLGETPSSQDVAGLFEGLSDTEREAAVKVYVEARLTQMGMSQEGEISLSQAQLTSIIASLPTADQDIAGQHLTQIDPDNVTYNADSNRLTVNGGSVTINREALSDIQSRIHTSTRVADDVLDGDNRIAGVDNNIAEQFTRNFNPQAEGFDPNSMGFSFVQTRQAAGRGGGDQSVEIIEDVRYNRQSERAVDVNTGQAIVASPTQLRGQLAQQSATIGGQEVNFADYAAEHDILNDDGSFNPEGLDELASFIDGLPDTSARMNFASRFATAYFAHSGNSASQTGIDTGNIEDALVAQDSADQRYIIDCNQYSALMSRMLGGHDPGGLEGSEHVAGDPMRTIPVVLSNTDPSLPAIGHQISYYEEEGTYFIQNNNTITRLDPAEVQQYMEDMGLEELRATDLVDLARDQGLLPDNYAYRGVNHDNDPMHAAQLDPASFVGTGANAGQTMFEPIEGTDASYRVSVWQSDATTGAGSFQETGMMRQLDPTLETGGRTVTLPLNPTLTTNPPDPTTADPTDTMELTWNFTLNNIDDSGVGHGTMTLTAPDGSSINGTYTQEREADGQVVTNITLTMADGSTQSVRFPPAASE